MTTRKDLGDQINCAFDRLFSALSSGLSSVDGETYHVKLREIRNLGEDYLKLAPENRAMFEKDFWNAQMGVAEFGATKRKTNEDPFRPTGGGFLRRVGQDHLVSSRDEQVTETTSVHGHILGVFPVIMHNVPTGQTYHQRVVEHFNDRGQRTGKSVYDRDCFGRRIR